MALLYGDLGRRDRVLLLIFLILVAWPDHWVRMAFILLVGVFELRMGDASATIWGHEIKAWERRTVSVFAILMAMSKLIWWSLACAVAVVAVREAFKRRGWGEEIPVLVVSL